MKSIRGNSSALQEEDDDYEEDFSAKREGTSNTTKDAKSSDKANAVRSKHSVTEQRRRSKINERFQILRDLIPHGDQKRDTASFLLEVIEYVQVLQEKVQKYEGSYQAWSTEATKLMPWRHSHWRVQNLLGHPQPVKNGAGPGLPFTGKLDEKSISIDPSVTANAHTSIDSDSNQDAYRMLGEPHPELAAKVHALPSPFQVHMPVPVHTDGTRAHTSQGSTSDAQSIDYPLATDNHQDERAIEGGTISISSAYSHELLTNLTQALQSSGVDLSKASISIQIDLGKRANQSLAACSSHVKESNNVSRNLAMTHHRDGSGAEELEQAPKRLKT